MEVCPNCQSKEIAAVEYWPTHPDHYDGISEFECENCGYRQGRWTGKALRDGEHEKPLGGVQ